MSVETRLVGAIKTAFPTYPFPAIQDTIGSVIGKAADAEDAVLRQQIVVLQGQVANLTTRVIALEQAISSFANTQSQTNAQIAGLTTQISSQVATTVNALRAQLDVAVANIDNILARLDASGL